MDKDLRCCVCKQLCPCDLYGGKEPHAHAPGGLLEYPLCKQHERECIEIHRPIDDQGKWKWINNYECGDAQCGYCRTLG